MSRESYDKIVDEFEMKKVFKGFGEIIALCTNDVTNVTQTLNLIHIRVLYGKVTFYVVFVDFYRQKKQHPACFL